MAVRIKNLGIVPDKDTVAMMDTPGSHVRTFEEIAQERGSVYVNRLVKDEQTSQLWLLDYQGFETSHVHSLGVHDTTNGREGGRDGVSTIEVEGFEGASDILREKDGEHASRCPT